MGTGGASLSRLELQQMNEGLAHTSLTVSFHQRRRFQENLNIMRVPLPSECTQEADSTGGDRGRLYIGEGAASIL